MSEIKLSRDEMETHINFTAQERIDGTIEVYTDDPVWIRKCESIQAFEDIGPQNGINPPARLFRSQNSAVTVGFRLKREYSEEQREALRQRMAGVRNAQD